MRDETANYICQTSHNLIKTTSWIFSYATYLQKPNYRIQNRPRSECKSSKLTMAQVFLICPVKASQLKIYRLKTTNYEPTSMTFWTAGELHF